MGNLNRHGDVHGFHHDDNAILAYLCGKFHLALVTEAKLDDRARMTTVGTSLRHQISSLWCCASQQQQRRQQVLLVEFWETMVHNRAQVVFGDFNKKAYRNMHQEDDRLNNTMKHYLEVVISRCQVPIQFLMLRVDAGTRPEEQILACCSEEDTMLVFFLDSDGAGEKAGK